jgi:MFS family permease
VSGGEVRSEGAPPARRGPLAGLTRNVYVLGAASLCTDVASEMLAPVRILFLVLVLGTPLPLAGLIEGVAESTASLLKIVAGRLAGRVAWRRPLILAGYGLSAGAKPLLALAGAWPAVLALVFLDRIGKGLRGSPRDALLADATAPAYRGKAFGLHRALDTAGGALGPLLTVLILARHGQTLQDLLPDPALLRQVFAWSAPAGAAAVLVLLLFLRPAPAPSPVASTPDRAPGVRAAISARPLGAPFWRFTAIATLFALGNSSDAFLFLRTIGLESWLEAVPLIYCGYNLVYAALATPLGALSDRRGRTPVLLAGYAAFALVYAGWAVANQGWHTWVLFLLYGVYAAATDGVGKALVVDLVPRDARGRALGWFNGLTGFAALPANLLAGLAWDRYGPGSTFTLGAALAAAAFLALLLCCGTLRRPCVPA